MVQEQRELSGLIEDGYIPSSVERKKAVLMYFFVGLVITFSQKRIKLYELFHLKQALGWWMTFFVCFVVGIIFVFIPYVWLVPLILFIALLVVWIVFVKQAREGKYVIGDGAIFMPFFASLGGWVVSIFELDIEDDSQTPDQIQQQ